MRDAAHDLRRQFEKEWRVMARDPLFWLYGGEDAAERRAAYVRRRIDEIRRNLTPYLHRPECLALAEALETERAEASS